MPTQVFEQHHILVNLNPEPHMVENWRNGEHRNFTFHKDEVVITPAGVSSGWQWHMRSKVIVITIDPIQLERFALQEVGVILEAQQLKDIPQQLDIDLSQAAELVLDALQKKVLGFEVLFESLSRVFLVKLIGSYGNIKTTPQKANKGFNINQYKKVFDFIGENFPESLTVTQMAKVAGVSRSHFSRLFKDVVGRTPMQFLQEYRLEQARKMLKKTQLSLSEIAISCGFSDQSHFSRLFKESYGTSPNQDRK